MERSASLRNGRIQYWHPLAKFNAGFRVGKLSKDEQWKVLDSINTLINRAPSTSKEIPTGTHKLARKSYLDGLEKLADKPLELEASEPSDFERLLSRVEKIGDTDKLKSELATALDESHRLRKKVKALEEQILAKDGLIEDMQDTLGKRAGRELSISIGEVLKGFEEHWGSPRGGKRQTDDIKAAAKRLLNGQAKKKWSSLTLSKIQEICKSDKPNSQIKKRQTLRIVARWACSSVASGGLGFRIDPTKSLVIGTLRPTGKDLLDPRSVKPKKMKEDEEAYLAALVGVLGFAGLRLGEAARLRWADIDFDQNIIHVAGTKTEQSERPVKPFGNLWPVLANYRQTDLGKGEDLVFPRFNEPKCTKPWKSAPLSIWLKRRTGGNEPALRLRRWFCTQTDIAGLGDLGATMAAHTAKVHKDYYVKNLEVIKSLEMPTLPQLSKSNASEGSG